MSGPSAASSEPIRHRQQLIDSLASGSKPKSAWRIGTEHEKFGFRLDDLRPLTWEGEQGIGALLEGLTRFGWQRVSENGKLIALSRDGASVTLEPAGQFELSGAPLETIHQTCVEINSHLREVKSVADGMGVGFLGMGFQPKWRREDMPWMPKGRYAIMRRYMPTVGKLGLDMGNEEVQHFVKRVQGWSEVIACHALTGEMADHRKRHRIRDRRRRIHRPG